MTSDSHVPADSARITALEPEGRGRVQVWVEGESVGSLPAVVATALRLRPGLAVPKDTADWLAEEEQRRAHDTALAYLGTRSRSRAEVERRLLRAGYGREPIEAVVAALSRAGYLDDATFAAEWVGARTRNSGRNRLAAELRGRGVAQPTVEEALRGVDGEQEEATAVELARSRLPSLAALEPTLQRRRLLGYLSRRGYGWETASRAVRVVLGEDDL